MHPAPFPVQSDTKCFFDCELFNNAFFVVCKAEGQYYLFGKKEKSEMLKTLWDKAVMIGFNNSSYDFRMVSAFLKGAGLAELKALNDEIISKQSLMEKQGFSVRQKNNHYDTKIGCLKKDRSLKEWQLMLGMSVEESPIPFDSDITRENMDLAVNYCVHDVDATEKLFNEKCIDNFNAIRILCEMAKQKVNYSKTIGSVTVDLLCFLAGKDKSELGCDSLFDYTDIMDRLERSGYLDMDAVKEVMESVLEYEKAGMPEVKNSYFGHIPVRSMNVELGAGGAHWCSSQKLWEDCDDSDVTSMYPNIMLAYLIIDRVLGPEGNKAFSEMIKTRQNNKKKNPELANALKIAINSVYGKLSGEGGLNDHSGRLAVCVIGQLAICDLVARYMEHIPECEIAQLNTDGVIYKFDKKKHKQAADEQMKEWSSLFGMGLETAHVEFMYQHNINNYVAEIKEDGKTEYKYRGGFFKSSNGTNEYIYKSLIHFVLHGEKPDIRTFPSTDFIEIVKSKKIGGSDSRYDILVNGKSVPNRLVPYVKTAGGVPISFRNPLNGKISGALAGADDGQEADDSLDDGLEFEKDAAAFIKGPKTLPASCTPVFRKDDALALKPDYETLDLAVDEALETLKKPMKETRKLHWKEAWQKEKAKNWLKGMAKHINCGTLPGGASMDAFMANLEAAGLSKGKIKEWRSKNMMNSVDDGDMT